MKSYVMKIVTLTLICLTLGSLFASAEMKPGLPKLYLNDLEVNAEYLIADSVLYLNANSLAPFGAKVCESTPDRITMVIGNTELRIDLASQIASIYPIEESKLLPKSYGVISVIRKDQVQWFSLKDLAPYMGYHYSRINNVDLYRLTDGSQTITPEALYEVVTALPKKVSSGASATDQKNYAPNKGDTSPAPKKIVYLTFDDGPNQHTDAIIKLLNKYNQKATFFMLYNGIVKQPETVKLIEKSGHGLGLHGVTHRKSLFYKADDSPLKEMNTANKALEKVLKQRTALIRTPYGSKPYLSSAQYKLLSQSGYMLWDWNVDSGDSAKSYVAPKVIETRVITGLKAKNTPVVLLHDKACTLDSLESILKWMKANGYVSKALTDEMTPLNWSK